MTGLVVKQPGILSLIQDGGRTGQHRIGLSTGGPLDRKAMWLANRLVHNAGYATALEVSFGGLELESRCQSLVAITGGDLPLSINDREIDRWCSHWIEPGDRIKFGYAQNFCRAYLAVNGGFEVPPQFGSTATVVREMIGGLNGGKLERGDFLPCSPAPAMERLRLVHADRPDYSTGVELRVIPGYQQHYFSRFQQRVFFNTEYQVSARSDRMGYRLDGPAITCSIKGILSEGICLGAIQVPADGQPIVLLNDRQTIGGYPKIGAALSLDIARLAQLMPGGRVRFAPVSQYAAHNALHLEQSRLSRLRMEPC